MPYDTPRREEYFFPAVNLAAAFSRNIRGPKGHRGRVRSVEGSVTTTSAGATTTPIVTVTTTVAPIPPSPSVPPLGAQTAVLSYNIGAVAAPAGFSSDALPGSVLRDANNALYVVPADADLVVAVAPATGAGAAGVADLKVIVDWF